MRWFGWYNLGGGTVGSAFDFVDAVERGDPVAATTSGANTAAGALEIYGLVARSAVALRYARALGAPGALVSSGLMGWQIGTHLRENYVDQERAMAGGEWVEEKMGLGSVVGAFAAAYIAAWDAQIHLPKAAIDWAGRTWTVDPGKVDWGKTSRPWRWFD